MSDLKVKQLAIYPVKSLGQVTRQRLQLDGMGAVDDRRFMAVDENGMFITQRTCTEMALIEILEEAGQFILRRPDGATCPLPQLSAIDGRCLEGKLVNAEIWGDQVQVPAVAGEVNHWLRETLKRDCRLLYIPKQRARQLDKEFAPEGALVGFADRFPLLLTASASLQDFNTHLESPIAMRRFRPNIEIEGGEPWAEDGWQRLQIGEVVFRVAAPCARCQIPSIDPNTGAMQPSVSRALAKHRRRDGQIYFGQNLIQESLVQEDLGIIAVGDKVQILD